MVQHTSFLLIPIFLFDIHRHWDRSNHHLVKATEGRYDVLSFEDRHMTKKVHVDKKFYAKALEEFTSNTVDSGTFAQCLAEANGNESETKAFYVKRRALELSLEDHQRHPHEPKNEQHEDRMPLPLAIFLVLILSLIGTMINFDGDLDNAAYFFGYFAGASLIWIPLSAAIAAVIRFVFEKGNDAKYTFAPFWIGSVVFLQALIWVINVMLQNREL